MTDTIQELTIAKDTVEAEWHLMLRALIEVRESMTRDRNGEEVNGIVLRCFEALGRRPDGRKP